MPGITSSHRIILWVNVRIKVLESDEADTLLSGYCGEDYAVGKKYGDPWHICKSPLRARRADYGGAQERELDILWAGSHGVICCLRNGQCGWTSHSRMEGLEELITRGYWYLQKSHRNIYRRIIGKFWTWDNLVRITHHGFLLASG